MKLQAWAILGSISTDSRAQCVHVFLAPFCWFLQWFRIVVVFLLGLHASARMTACCACLGVGFIVIPFFVFLRMQDVARTSNIALLLWQTRRADQDSFFQLPPLVSLLNSCDLQDQSGHHE